MARKLAPDKWLFAATIGLALFGVVMVYSASAVIAQKENGNQFHYVIKQGMWVAIGFVVMLGFLVYWVILEDGKLKRQAAHLLVAGRAGQVQLSPEVRAEVPQPGLGGPAE